MKKTKVDCRFYKSDGITGLWCTNRVRTTHKKFLGIFIIDTFIPECPELNGEVCKYKCPEPKKSKKVKEVES